MLLCSPKRCTRSLRLLAFREREDRITSSGLMGAGTALENAPSIRRLSLRQQPWVRRYLRVGSRAGARRPNDLLAFYWGASQSRGDAETADRRVFRP